MTAPDKRTRPAAIHSEACEREQMPSFERARARPTRRSTDREVPERFDCRSCSGGGRRLTATVYEVLKTVSLRTGISNFIGFNQEGKIVRRRRSVASQPYRLFKKRTTPLPLLQLCELGSPHDDTRKPFLPNPYPRYGRYPHAADNRSWSPIWRISPPTRASEELAVEIEETVRAGRCSQDARK